MTKRTSAYRFTIQSKDDPRLLELKKEVSERNKNIPWSEPTHVNWFHKRVRMKPVEEIKIAGRLGKNNPNAHLYRVSGPYRWKTSILHEHAGHFDVYVHRMNRFKPA